LLYACISDDNHGFRCLTSVKGIMAASTFD
jgi:hypothetical protein